MSRPRLLDAFCGEGGCWKGYTEAGFDVVGVDMSKARLGDAIELILERGHEFDAIHASPTAKHVRKGGYVPSADVQRALVGVPWMTEKGCQLSIPPVYAEFVGRQLLEHIQAVAA